MKANMSAPDIKILLVDDHPMMREGVRRLLSEQAGMRVVGEAASFQTALKQVHGTQPDVIVMDIHLPGENGIEISERVLSEFPKVKIVVLSADTDLTTVQRALHAGVSGYISKNAPPEEMVRAIHAAVDQRMYLCPELASVVMKDYLNAVVKPSAPAAPVLTERERLLLRLVAEGKRNKEIAVALKVGLKSVETYRSRLMRKVGCSSAADLTRYAIREGISSI